MNLCEFLRGALQWALLPTLTDRSHISQPLGSIVRFGSQRLRRHLHSEEYEKGIPSRETEDQVQEPEKF